MNSINYNIYGIINKDLSPLVTRGMNKKNHVTAITNVHGVFKAELPATR